MALRVVVGRVGDIPVAKGDESRLEKLSETGDGGEGGESERGTGRDIEGVIAVVLIERGIVLEMIRDRGGLEPVEVRKGEEGREGGLRLVLFDKLGEADRLAGAM